MEYLQKHRLEPLGAQDGPAPLLAAVYLPAEWPAAQKKRALPAAMEQELASARFTKAELWPEEVIGTFSVPLKRYAPGEDRRFAFCIRGDGVFFLDGSGTVAPLLEQIARQREWSTPSPGLLFYAFLEGLTQRDLPYLDEVERRIANLEEAVLGGTLEEFSHKMARLRRELRDRGSYYRQLMDLCLELQEDQGQLFSPQEVRLFHLFSDRVSRLYETVQSLREYSMQVREAYQAETDLRANRIMKVLTVVTTLFFPLTLIAGWYGMNFVNMPELHWRYGYLCIILISAAVVAFSVWFFKKKRFF